MIVRMNHILQGNCFTLTVNDRKSPIRFEGGVHPEPIAAADDIARSCT